MATVCRTPRPISRPVHSCGTCELIPKRTHKLSEYWDVVYGTHELSFGWVKNSSSLSGVRLPASKYSVGLGSLFSSLRRDLFRNAPLRHRERGNSSRDESRLGSLRRKARRITYRMSKRGAPSCAHTYPSAPQMHDHSNTAYIQYGTPVWVWIHRGLHKAKTSTRMILVPRYIPVARIQPHPITPASHGVRSRMDPTQEVRAETNVRAHPAPAPTIPDLILGLMIRWFRGIVCRVYPQPGSPAVFSLGMSKATVKRISTATMSSRDANEVAGHPTELGPRHQSAYELDV
ncbi:hypothetical protein B0H13DRAFT_2511963 [Mycena leptocephala]|nr:hypothetical protein B0H13DRAFT_2511963 [Mycena leptocephala]